MAKGVPTINTGPPPAPAARSGADYGAQADDFLSGLGSGPLPSDQFGGQQDYYNKEANLRNDDSASTAAMYQWQQKLILGGYLKPGMSITPGAADEYTRVATARVIEKAHALGITPEEELDYEISGGGSRSSGPHYKPPIHRPIDDKVLNLGITDAFQTEYGRGPTDSELTNFRNAFRARENQYFGEEDSASKSQFEAGLVPGQTEVDSGSAAAVGRLPTPGQFVEGSIQDDREAQGYRAAQAGLKLLDMMKSSG